MKSRSCFRWKIITSALGLMFLGRSSFASFSPLAVGARPAGMGEAFTAISDDVYSLYYNPAGLAQLERPELGAYYSRLFTGLSDGSDISRSFVGYGQPLGTTTSYGALGIDFIELNLSDLYTEQTFGMSYAYQFFQKLNVGGSFKLLRKSIGSGDPSTTNAIDSTTGQPFSSAQSDPLLAGSQSKSAPAMDIGAQYELFPHYWVAAAIRNINSPNMAIGGGDSDPAPTYSTIGFARKNVDSALDLDISQYKTTVTNTRVSVGGEKWLDAIGLRGGLAFGTQDFAAASFGASYRFKNFQMDYAMNLPLEGVQGTFGNQQISLTMRFGEKPESRLESEILDERKMRLQAEARTIQLRNERDRLKTQIRQLTEEDNSAANSIQDTTTIKKTAALTPVLAKKSPLKSHQEKKPRPISNSYAQALDDYEKARKAGATPVARLNIINGIINKFKSSGTDLSVANNEAAALTKYINGRKFQYSLSMRYYKRLVDNGTTIDDRRTMIELIIKKYGNVGFDISPAQEELIKINKINANN